MTTSKVASSNDEVLIMSITLESRTLASSKRSLVRAKVAMLAKRPEPVGSAQPSAAESFKFRLAAEPWALYILKDAIIATDKGIESFPYGKGTMLRELYK